MRLPWLRALFALLVPQFSAACGDPSSDSNPILHFEEGRLVDGRERPVVLRGAAFANGALATPFDPGDTEAFQSSTDYARLAELGMNFAQFYLNARLFERDEAPYVYSEEGFAFVDRNLGWAREHGVYLMLTLAVPAGGEQLACGGDTLWDEPALADRMTALWEALATRYANDPSVAGYRILRTPLPSGDASQWRDLAAETVARIRAVDREHLIVVDRADGARCAPDDALGESFVGSQIDDPNLMNAFEFRWPYEFTNQLIDEIGFGEQGPYPNDQRLLIDWNESEFQHASWDSRPGETALWLKPDETEWTEKRFWYTVTDPDFQFAFPDLQSRNNRGTVYFDDLVIREFDEDGEFVRTVVDYDVETSGPWYLWQPPEENGTGVVGISSDSHRGNASLTLSNTSTDAALSASMLAFRLELGHTYEVTSWIKGEDVSDSAESMLRLDFWTGPGTLTYWNRQGLSRQLEPYLAWSQEHRAPLFVSEFGTSRPTFDGDHGGLAWTADALDLMLEGGLHFSYFAYRDGYFGLVPGDPNSTDEPENRALAELFAGKLRR